MSNQDKIQRLEGAITLLHERIAELEESAVPVLEKGWPVRTKNLSTETWQTGYFYKDYRLCTEPYFHIVTTASGSERAFKLCELDPSATTEIRWIPHLTDGLPKGFIQTDRIILKWHNGEVEFCEFREYLTSWAEGKIVAYARPVDNWSKS